MASAGALLTAAKAAVLICPNNTTDFIDFTDFMNFTTLLEFFQQLLDGFLKLFVFPFHDFFGGIGDLHVRFELFVFQVATVVQAIAHDRNTEMQGGVL